MVLRNMPCPVSISDESLIDFKVNQVTVGASPVPLDVTGFEAHKSVKIKALAANSVSVYIGNASVTTSTGFELPPGQELELKIYDLTTVFVVASSPAKVSWIAV